MLTGINMVPVHYRGAAPAMTDLIAGRVQVMFDAVVSSLSYIKSGQIRALAVTTANAAGGAARRPDGRPIRAGLRSKRLAGRLRAEEHPGRHRRAAQPRDQRRPRRRRFQSEARRARRPPFPGTPADWGKFIDAETDKWGKVVREAGLKAE